MWTCVIKDKNHDEINFLAEENERMKIDVISERS